MVAFRVRDNYFCGFSLCFFFILFSVKLCPVATLRYLSTVSVKIRVQHCVNQCCGSMEFWCRSGSADPYLWLMDPDPDADPDPAIFDIFDSYLEDVNKKNFLGFLLIMVLFEVHLHHFSKIKSHKEVTEQLESMFFLLFLLYDRRIRILISY